MPFDGTASLWLASTALPVGKPFAITSSPNGRTLYVGCVGNGSNGVVVAIDVATKAQTVIASGLSYVKHGMFCDAIGNLYWAVGGNDSNTATSTVYKRDVSTGVVSSVWSAGGSFFGMALDSTAQVAYYQHRNASDDYARARSLVDGSILWTTTVFEFAGQHRGFAVTGDYVLVCDNNGGRVWKLRPSDGFFHGEDSVWNNYPHGIAVVSDTETYVITVAGDLYEYNPVTQAKIDIRASIGLPLANTGIGDLNYSNIHITSQGVGFVVRGGWTADPSNARPEDHGLNNSGAAMTDVGIYVCDPIPTGRRPVVGRIGFG